MFKGTDLALKATLKNMWATLKNTPFNPKQSLSKRFAIHTHRL